MLARPFHIPPFFGPRQLGTAATHVLALFVVVAQPVASLAWLGGMHATLGQIAHHHAAVEHGYDHHHGASVQQEHQPAERYEMDAHLLRTAHDPGFASAVPHAGAFQGLLQTLLQTMLVAPPDAPSPGGAPLSASLAEDLPSQYSPPVPHRPPILPLPNLVVL